MKKLLGKVVTMIYKFFFEYTATKAAFHLFIGLFFTGLFLTKYLLEIYLQKNHDLISLGLKMTIAIFCFREVFLYFKHIGDE